MALHIFGHIKPHQLNTQGFCQLLTHFGFTDTGRPGKQEATNGLLGRFETCTRETDIG